MRMARAGWHLDKLQRLQSQLAHNGGGAAEQHMPQVMHLARPLGHICQLHIVHKADWRPFVCSEVPAAHELAVGMPEGAHRHAGR